MYYNLLPGKQQIKIKDTKSIRYRTTGSEERHITIVLADSAAGNVFPPIIIFKGKQPLTVQTTRGWAVCVQEKAGLDRELMLHWIKDIFPSHTKKECLLLAMDSFLQTV